MIKIISYVKLLQKCNMLENIKDTLETDNAILRAHNNQLTKEKRTLKDEVKELHYEIGNLKMKERANANKRRELSRELREARKTIKNMEGGNGKK